MKILEIVMLHQIPFSPSAVCVSSMAKGIRAAVSTMPTTDGGTVRPKPANAPAVVISTLMNNWDTPRIIR